MVTNCSVALATKFQFDFETLVSTCVYIIDRCELVIGAGNYLELTDDLYNICHFLEF